jgi:hypothetical protein
MRLEKPDRIVALKRDTAQTVATLDRLWKHSIRLLHTIDENNWPNYRLVEFASDLGANPAFENHFIDKLNVSLDMLDILRFGHYQDPNKPDLRFYYQ